MKLEKRLQEIPKEIVEAIKFYESHLSNQDLKECRVAEGTDYYVDLLVEKYEERFKR